MQSRYSERTFGLLISAYVIFSSIIFLQRFAIVMGGFPFQLTFILVCLTLLWMLNKNIAALDTNRVKLYLIMVAVFSFLFIFSEEQGSLPSLGLVFAIYLLFTLRVDMNSDEHKEVINVYQNIMLVVAIAGLMQFLLQFVITTPLLFSFYGVLPDTVLMPGFNTLIPLHYGAEIYKVNGMVMLEPSTFSQFLAIAVIVELLYFDRKSRLLIYLAAMMLTYSGTGLIMLMLFAPIVLIQQRKWKYIFVLVLFLGVIFSLGGILDTDIYVDRAASITSEKTSGFARFIGPLYFANQFLLSDTKTFLLGAGAGTIQAFSLISDVPTHDPAWLKLFFEYGIFGSCIFLLFLCYSLFLNTHSKLLSSMFLVKYLFLGGTFLSQMDNMLAIAIVVLPWKSCVIARTEVEELE